MQILKRIPKPSGSLSEEGPGSKASPKRAAHPRASSKAAGAKPRPSTRRRHPPRARAAPERETRAPVSQAAFNAAVEELLALGFTDRRGKPKTGERPLGPALAERFHLQIRQVRVLLRRRRAPFAKGSVLPRPASGGPPVAPAKETPAVYAARMKLQRALGTKVELHDQSATGVIVVHWSGYAHLEELMAKLGA